MRRPSVSRYFPPGYFDRSFWLMAGLNIFTPVWCAVWAYLDAREGDTINLALQCGALTLGLFTGTRCVRMMARHSREWRTNDRPKLAAAIAEAEMQKIAEDFAEFHATQRGRTWKF
ncbi:hypothetical protein FVF58_15870 [Paraburkholderia panacisoli]|uniref:Uncharacterized protein n=1 Tax=Paraburkholderia panacisoli TaxID=2603818 RepID=A0A5B0H8F1_9BURK|nr:hypothetical protein [Paraburkholderia panacisoli]KAA1011401.1 hypothetical protein FVF58_15870 [Paraburkholderia panacisoli]